MSRERGRSLDRSLRQKQRPNIYGSGGYIPGRSPNRSPPITHGAPRCVPSTPEIFRYQSLGEFDACRQDQFQYGHHLEGISTSEAKGPQGEHYTLRAPQIENLPDEFLEEYVEPSFYEPPANDSYDELMCILASPAPPTSTPHEMVSTVQSKDDEVRRLVSEHLPEAKVETPLCPYVMEPLPDDPNVIPPHPKDPTDVVAIIRRARAIQRLRAIEEAEAANAPKSAVKKLGRGATVSRKPGAAARRPGTQQTTAKAKAPPGKRQLKTIEKRPDKLTAVQKKKNECPVVAERPPDYIAPEYAAAVLRARELAGLKTRNPKLLPQQGTPPPLPPTKTPPPRPATPPPPTYENIMQRAALIRAKTDAGGPQCASVPKQEYRKYSTDLQDQLEEFEALEQFYGAHPDQCASVPKQEHRKYSTDLQDQLEEFEALEQLYDAHPEQFATVPKQDISMADRIENLQRKLFESPPQTAPESPVFDLPPIMQDQLEEFEALEKLYDAHPEQFATVPKQDISMADRIENLQRKLFESPPQTAPESPVFDLPPIIRYYDLMKRHEEMLAEKAVFVREESQVPECEVDLQQIKGIADWELAELSGPPVCPSPHYESTRATPRVVKSHTSPDRSPAKIPPVCYPIPATSFGTPFLQNMEFSEFDITDVPEYGFSAEALADISMPGDIFGEDASLEELEGLEDISSPELDNLSISMAEALEQDYPLELSDDGSDGIADEEHQKSAGFLTSVVSAVVDKFRNIFGGSPREVEEEKDELSFNLESSLPNLFETTPPPKPPTPSPKKVTPQSMRPKAPSPERPIVIPPHPKDPMDYATMVKRAQLIQKLKAREAAEAAIAATTIDSRPKKPVVKTSIPKRAPAPAKQVLHGKKKKSDPPPKIYPPGEYSPGYAEAVARARVLAGFKNRSAVLNPKRAAKIAALKAERESALAAEEALPPVERMQKRIARLIERRGQLLCVRPSIETLGTLEAIRESLPKPEMPSPPKRKWTPAVRRVKRSDLGFSKQYERAFGKIKPMTPIKEESYDEADLMRFSPLRPHEGRLRLQYLRELAQRRAAESEVSPKTPHFDSPKKSSPRTREISSVQFTPIRLRSPSSPRKEEMRKETVTTKLGENGGEESIREEITEMSTIENGEVHTTTRKVTTKTDEFGNVTCHLEESKGLTGEEETIMENIDTIEAPEFLDSSDIPPQCDPSIPTPSEIINRIRLEVQQKLNLVLPQVPESPSKLDFPEDLPDEQLLNVDMPELGMTPPQAVQEVRERSPNISLPYCLGEIPASTPQQESPPHQPSPLRVASPVSEQVAESIVVKPKSPERPIVIPPHPKDPMDYVTMVKRAQAIQQLKKQQEAEVAALAPSPRAPATKKFGRVPTKKPRKLVLKKKPPKMEQEIEEEEYRGYPAEPPPIPADYAAAVARARQLAGYKNRTAALNPTIAAELAAKKAAKEAELAAFENLPEYQKIMKRMEKVRRIPPQERTIKPTADVLGMIAAIRANMPPIEEVLRPPTPTPPSSTTPRQSPSSQKSAHEMSNVSLKEFEAIEQELADALVCEQKDIFKRSTSTRYRSENIADISLEEFEALEKQTMTSPSEVVSPSNNSLDEFEALERQLAAETIAAEEGIVDKRMDDFKMRLYGLSETPKGIIGASRRRNIIREFTPTQPDISLEEFEALEKQAMTSPSEVVSPSNNSLDEFEALERQLAAETIAAEEGIVDKRMDAFKMGLYGLSETPKGIIGASRRRNIIREFTPTQPGPSPRKYVKTTMEPESQIPSNEPTQHTPLFKNQEFRPVDDQEFYNELIADLGTKPNELQTVDGRALDDLMPPTPLCPKERFRKIKEAQQRPALPREIDMYEEACATPSPAYSPISFLSPSGVPYTDPACDAFPDRTAEDDILINLQTPKKQIAGVKQFGDLEDVPFDELEFEDEPTLMNVSFDKPMTPPPQPSELINRIREQVQMRLRKENADRSQIRSPCNLKFPDELPDEDLFELSPPSFAQTPERETPKRQRTPRVSLPYAWGEVAPTTPPPTPPAVSASPPSPTITPISAQPEPVVECPKVPSPEGPIIVPPHPKDPKDYAAMVKRSQAIYKLQKQQEAESALADPASHTTKQKGRMPISKRGEPHPRDRKTKLRRKLVMKKNVGTTKKEQQPTPADVDVETECPAEPPPIPTDYAEAVARARLLAGYKNRTAALNPAIAARIAQKKAAAEAEAAAFAALSDQDKIKVRMERLRSKSRRSLHVKPTMEQLAFLQHMKENYVYESPRPLPSPRGIVEAKTPSASPPQRLSVTPRHTHKAETTLADLAHFEALEQMEAPPPQVCPEIPQDNLDMEQHMAALERQLFAPEECPILPPVATQIDPRERYKQLLTQIKSTPKTQVAPISPVKTPDIRYSPIALYSSPTSPERSKRTEKSTTQITRSGDNTIKEQVTETSEIVNGELQHVTKHVTTTTDPSSNITCQINESKRVKAIDTSATIEELEDIGEPSFLDTTPISPTGAPRPKDIIDRIRRNVQSRPRSDVPTGRLIELRTPPRELPLPQEVPEEELLEISCPALPKTPPRTPTPSPRRSPERRTPNISIPELFMATPPPPTPPLPPVSPLRHRVPSPEGPIAIPEHPKDPTDYATMVRRARKIQQLKAQEEAEARAAAEAEAAAAQAAAIEASKPKKKERVPISRWTAPAQKKAETRKKPTMKKREHVPGQATASEMEEEPSEPPPLPEGYAEQIARARCLAGLKNTTAALNPKVAEREAAKAEAATEASRIAQEREAARIATLNDPPPPPADYETLMSKIAAMREQGHLPEAAIAYSPLKTPRSDDISYTPIRFDSPGYDIADPATMDHIEFDVENFEGLQDLGELEDLEEPSFMEVSESPTHMDQYTPTSPMTPQPTPSRLISRIREQVHRQMAADNLVCPAPSRTPPAALNFPDDLPEDDLFELSAPSFAKTPQRQHTPARSANISIPVYFESTPPPNMPTPKIDTPKAASPYRSKSPSPPIALTEEAASPPLLGVYPGVRVRTPEGPIVIPPHPKDPADVFAMIQRAQLIQKLKAKQDVEKDAALKLAKGARLPISMRPGGPSRKGRPLARTTTNWLRPDGKGKHERTDLPPECPVEAPQLPSDYTAAVARARTLAGLKNTTAVLNPVKPPQDYGTIMARAALLKSQMGQLEPTARELAEAQHIINSGQRQERRRHLRELEQRRKEEGDDVSLDFGQLQTPPPAMERYRALRSRIPSETPTTSQIPYSPVKTPDIVDLPAYKPIALAPSPPCRFLQNVSEPHIGDVSMPAEFQNNFSVDANDESNDFQQRNVALNRRVEMLQNQYLQSPRQISISPRTACVLPDSIESPGLVEFEALEQYDAGPSHRTPSQRSELKKMIDDLNRLEQISKAQEQLLCEGEVEEKPLSTTDHAVAATLHTRLLPGMSPATDEYSALQSFEAMERFCRTPRHR